MENKELNFTVDDTTVENIDLTVDILEEMLDDRRFSEFREAIDGLPGPDLAELIWQMVPKRRLMFFRLLPKETAADVFIELDPDLQRELINSFTDRELSEILDEMYYDDTVDLIEEMPASVVKRIIASSDKEARAEINKLLRFKEDSAGAIMTTEYVRLTADMTVEAALTHIRRVAIDRETIYTCYVTDSNRRLVGVVTAKSLLLSYPDTLIEDIMEENLVSALTTDEQESVAMKFDKYGFIALPVVDSEDRLVGIVTVDDAMDVLREETEEDFAKMAAMTPTETPYIKTPVFKLWLSRIPWLLLLMVSATFSSTILSRFEAALLPVLVLFVPMLMDTGGNCGGQSSVSIIRSLSLGEIRLRDIFRVIWKEVRVGVFVGISLGVVAFGKVLLVDKLIMNNPDVTVIVALAVAISLALTVIMSKLIGACLPFLAKRIGFDPAVMASPFITTVVDAISLLLYFAIAGGVFGLVI